MSLLRRIFFYLVMVILVGLFAAGVVLRSDFFWRWAGGKGVSYVQQQLQGDLQVGEIQGNPFQGLFFKDIVLSTPEEELLRARSLEIRLSFWSLLELKPVIGKLTLVKPHLTLRQHEGGQWNVSQILPPASGMTTLKETAARLPVPIRSVRFSQILIIDGEVKITRAGQTQELKNLDVDLALEINDPLAPGQGIQVAKLMAAVSVPQGRISLTSRLSYKEHYLDFPLLEMKIGQQTLLSLAGKADLREGGHIQARGELALPAQEINRFWSQWPSDWQVAATFEAQGELSQIRLSLNGKIGETNLDLAGTLGQQTGAWSYDLKGNIKNLKPEILAIYDKSLVEKVSQLRPLAAQFHLQGTGFGFPPAQFSWTLEGQPWQYGSAKVDRFNFSLTGNKHKQELQGIIKGNIGQVALKGTGSLLTLTDGQFTFQMDGFNPAPLNLGAPEGTVINAKLDGKLSAPGVKALDRLKASGDIAASGKIGPHPLRKLQARLAWEKNKLQIAQANVQLGNLVAELKGSLDGETLDLSHQGKSTPGGNWPVPAGVGGQFSWEGTVRGPLTDPQVALRARGRGLSYEKFAVQTFTLNSNTTGLPPSEGEVSFQATGMTTPGGEFSHANFQGSGSDQLWNFTFLAEGAKNLKIELQGNAHLCDRELSLNRAFFRLKNVTARNLGPVEARFASGLEIMPATFQINQGRVSFQARVTDQQVTGSLDIQQLAAEWFVPQSIPLKGSISGKATLAGQASQPILEGNVNLGPGSYQGFDFQVIRTSFILRDNRLDLAGGLKTKDRGPALSWEGQVPLRFSLAPFSVALVQNGLRVVLQGENVDLSLLPSLTKEVERAEGPLKILARIEGNVDQPQVSGQVSWGAGSIQLRQTGATYQLQPGEIRLQGNRLSIPQLTLRSEGTTTLTGEVTLARFLPEDVRARIQLDNFKAIDKLGSMAFVNGTVTVNGRWPNLSVNGNLGIPKASFRLSFFNLGPASENKDVILVREQTADKAKTQVTQKRYEPEVWKKLEVNLDVRAPDNVWVDDRVAKIESALTISVLKRPGQGLLYYGKVRTLEGQVLIMGREFQVAKGIVDLPDRPGAEPFLDARIIYEMTDVTLYADATGPLNNPKITLGGDPPISENDWMAYLLYGKPAGALSREEQGAGVAAGAFGGLASQMILRDFLGMKRPLTKGLTVTYQRRTDPLYQDDPYQVVIKYRINKRFSLESQVGGRNTGGDVLFNYDF